MGERGHCAGVVHCQQQDVWTGKIYVLVHTLRWVACVSDLVSSLRNMAN